MNQAGPAVDTLTELTADVPLCQFFLRGFEKLLRGAELHQESCAPSARNIDREECSLVCNARGLMHIVGHNCNGVFLFEFQHQFFNGSCGDGIKCRNTVHP